MSRVGKKPILIPGGVAVNISGRKIEVQGKKGKLTLETDAGITVKKIDDGGVSQLVLEREGDSKKDKMLHGLFRSLVNNMIEGVVNGYSKLLQIEGMGYRVALQGKKLSIQVGFTHPVVVEPPEGIQFSVPEENKIMVTGIDKQLVGEVSARIRAIKPPEPYKGKGIRYVGEYVRRKVGKTGA